jgi:transcriptional regulator with XRE-family HTH domain
MKERIKEIMDNENLSPAKFADQLQINRAVISHILNGRNNPSLDVVTKILSEMNYINSDWLLNGTGSMYKDGFSAPTDKNERSLFDAGATNVRDNVIHSEYVKENDLRGVENTDKLTDMQHVSQVTGNNRKVKQIIIYYTDNTFETFTPH